MPRCDFRNLKNTNLQLQPVAYALIHIRCLQNGSAVLELKRVGCLIDGHACLITYAFFAHFSKKAKGRTVVNSVRCIVSRYDWLATDKKAEIEHR